MEATDQSWVLVRVDWWRVEEQRPRALPRKSSRKTGGGWSGDRKGHQGQHEWSGGLMVETELLCMSQVQKSLHVILGTHLQFDRCFCS